MQDQVDDPMAAMDLEMQLLPSSPPSANNNGTAATSRTTPLMQSLIRFIQSTIIFTEGRNHATVSRVSSSKSLDNSPQPHDQTVSRSNRIYYT